MRQLPIHLQWANGLTTVALNILIANLWYGESTWLLSSIGNVQTCTCIFSLNDLISEGFDFVYVYMVEQEVQSEREHMYYSYIASLRWPDFWPHRTLASVTRWL